MTSRKGAKAVTSRRTREWRVALADRWLAFALDTSSGGAALRDQLERLMDDSFWQAGRGRGVMVHRQLTELGPDLDEWALTQTLRHIQGNVRDAIVKLASEAEWQLLFTELPTLTFYAAKSASGNVAGIDSYDLALKAIFALVAFLATPEAGRFTTCAEPGCRNIYVRHKAGIFCAEHSTAAARAARFRAALAPAERSERRHKHYMNSLKVRNPRRYRQLMAKDGDSERVTKRS
jgi:hypothetical protein